MEINKTRKSLRGHRVKLFIALNYAVLAGILLVHYTPPTPTNIVASQRYTTELKDVSPTHIFIGNSMLVSRIEPELIQELVDPGVRIFLIAENGTATAFWYLAYKNYILPLHDQPEKVFIFFVGNDLTCPIEKLTVENHIAQIELARRGREETFERVINDFKYEGIKGRLVSLTDRLDIPDKQVATADLLIDIVTSATDTEQRVIDYTNQYFFWANFAVDRGEDVVADITNECGWDFDKDYPRSFLPHLIEMDQRSPSELVFIRVERMPNADGSPSTTEEEETYMASLFDHMKRNDIRYYDLKFMPGITGGFFRDAFHVSDSYAYTKVFYEYMKGEFE